MKNLIINAGSATYKYSLLDGAVKIASGLYERQLDSSLVHFMKKNADVNWKELDAIAFRVVHGGHRFHKPTVVTQSVLKQLKQLDAYAPLHNPFARRLILQTQKLFPKTKKVLIFDTGFHHSIPEVNWRYAIPREIADRGHFRRYGFHGIVCSSIVEQLKKRNQLPSRLIICHLGSGCSVTAVRDGRSVDTTMGFTPLEGLIMGTRAGDLDPGLVLALEKKLGVKKLEELLSCESGLKGLTGTSDMREIIKHAKGSNPAANLAVEMFAQKAAKEIAVMMISLGGLDLLTFSGGIGEHSPLLRERIGQHLRPWGVKVCSDDNLKNLPGKISRWSSSAKIMIMRANEDQEMNRIIMTML
jgi:acetate kinase